MKRVQDNGFSISTLQFDHFIKYNIADAAVYITNSMAELQGKNMF